jgi:hypothetical protein
MSEVEFYRVQVWDGKRAKWVRGTGRRYDLETAKRIAVDLLEDGFEARILRVVETIEELPPVQREH